MKTKKNNSLGTGKFVRKCSKKTISASPKKKTTVNFDIRGKVYLPSALNYVPLLLAERLLTLKYLKAMLQLLDPAPSSSQRHRYKPHRYNPTYAYLASRFNQPQPGTEYLGRPSLSARFRGGRREEEGVTEATDPLLIHFILVRQNILPHTGRNFPTTYILISPSDTTQTRIRT